MVHPSKLPGFARGNIESVAQISQNFVKSRSRIDRLGAAVTRCAASAPFLAGQVLVVAAWVWINLGMSPSIAPFDPFPFSLLGVMVSLEAVFLSTFVLMAQKRQTHQAEHWAHLNLQIGLLAEQEATKMLQMLSSISDRLGVPTGNDAELKEMAQRTVVDHLHQELAGSLAKAVEDDEP